jgi:hypothetical protein
MRWVERNLGTPIDAPDLEITTARREHLDSLIDHGAMSDEFAHDLGAPAVGHFTDRPNALTHLADLIQIDGLVCTKVMSEFQTFRDRVNRDHAPCAQFLCDRSREDTKTTRALKNDRVPESQPSVVQSLNHFSETAVRTGRRGVRDWCRYLERRLTGPDVVVGSKGSNEVRGDVCGLTLRDERVATLTGSRYPCDTRSAPSAGHEVPPTDSVTDGECFPGTVSSHSIPECVDHPYRFMPDAQWHRKAQAFEVELGVPHVQITPADVRKLHLRNDCSGLRQWHRE